MLACDRTAGERGGWAMRRGGGLHEGYRPGKIESAIDRGGRHPRLLRTAGRPLHREPDLVKGLKDVPAGRSNGFGERLGERAVAVGAVLGNIAGLRRIRD